MPGVRSPLPEPVAGDIEFFVVRGDRDALVGGPRVRAPRSKPASRGRGRAAVVSTVFGALPCFRREICWQGFCLRFLAANRAAGAKRKVRTVVGSCRNDRASDQSATVTGTMSGTQFWSDHIFIGQAVPTAIFPIELRVTAAKSALPRVQTVGATAEFSPRCGRHAHLCCVALIT